jgi:hypothetical protein
VALNIKCKCGGEAMVTAHSRDKKNRRCQCSLCGDKFLVPIKSPSGSGKLAGKIIYPGYVYGGTRLS